MFRDFFREYCRKRAIIAGVACPTCHSTDVAIVGKRGRGHRHCHNCDFDWQRSSQGFWLWYTKDGI